MAQQQHYSNADDFFELFEADTFDKEVAEVGVRWEGWVDYEGNGEELLAATFVWDADGVGGTGWIDDDVI